MGRVARHPAKRGHVLFFRFMSSARQAKLKNFKMSGFCFSTPTPCNWTSPCYFLGCSTCKFSGSFRDRRLIQPWVINPWLVDGCFCLELNKAGRCERDGWMEMDRRGVEWSECTCLSAGSEAGLGFRGAVQSQGNRGWSGSSFLLKPGKRHFYPPFCPDPLSLGHVQSAFPSPGAYAELSPMLVGAGAHTYTRTNGFLPAWRIAKGGENGFACICVCLQIHFLHPLHFSSW